MTLKVEGVINYQQQQRNGNGLASSVRHRYHLNLVESLLDLELNLTD